MAKFKRIDIGLLEIARAAKKTIEEIDAAMAGKRTAGERAGLEKVREDCEAILTRFREATGHLMEVIA